MKKEDFLNQDNHKNLPDNLKKILEGLTEEQFQAVGLVAGNKIQRQTGDLLGRVDQVITEITGQEKESGVKTSDFAKKALAEAMKNTSSEELKNLQTKLTTLEGERDELKTKLEAGSNDEELKKNLSLLQGKVEQAKNTIETQKTSYENKLKEANNTLKSFKIDNSITAIIPSLKGEDEGYKQYLVKQAIAKAKGQFEIDVDESGKLKAEKDLQSVDLVDFFKSELKDHIEAVAGGGAGGGQGSGGAGSSGLIDISGAKNFSEAIGLVEQGLEARGLKEGTEDFKKAWTENRTAIDEANLSI